MKGEGEGGGQKSLNSYVSFQPQISGESRNYNLIKELSKSKHYKSFNKNTIIRTQRSFSLFRAFTQPSNSQRTALSTTDSGD